MSPFRQHLPTQTCQDGILYDEVTSVASEQCHVCCPIRQDFLSYSIGSCLENVWLVRTTVDLTVTFQCYVRQAAAVAHPGTRHISPLCTCQVYWCGQPGTVRLEVAAFTVEPYVKGFSFSPSAHIVSLHSKVIGISDWQCRLHC